MERVEKKIGGTPLKIESGKVGNQANGAVWIQAGETVAIVSACSSEESKADLGFFPLTVEYREQSYAAGQIPGGFFKREGKPQTKEIISARLTDRSIRPLFPDDFYNEVQIHIIVTSFDQENDPDVLGITGASAALSLSDIPFDGAIAGARVGLVEGEYIINPTVAERELAELDLVVAGDGEDIIMVEGHSDEILEEELTGAMEFAMPYLKEQVELQKNLVDKSPSKEVMEYTPNDIGDDLFEVIEEKTRDKINKLIRSDSKVERSEAFNELLSDVVEEIDLEEEYPESSEREVKEAMQDIRKEELRKITVTEKKRIDGRDLQEVRPLSIEAGALPRSHGSCLFRRGETQALGVLTLGSKLDEQKIENLEGESWKNFLVHYNFPPFSVGDVRRITGPGRREIGHGILVERALRPVAPSEEEFPYTIRIVSDILESNGSSSMATACAGSLSLMDAGVPIKRPVAGIAMGLIVENDEKVILTDILGDEDHCGDMDFKVAGTSEGINAFQMDIKRKGINFDIISEALERAKDARSHILNAMRDELSESRSEISRHAPRIKTIQIDPEKIGAIIGKGGKVIQNMQEETGSEINVDDEGEVRICADDKESLDEVMERIDSIITEPEEGDIFEGEVKKITSFGAFVEIKPGLDGLLHISEIKEDYVEDVSTVLSVGDTIKVQILNIGDDGKVSLSRKAVR